jgi:translocation and assembly module TamB
VTRLAARRGAGTFSASGALRGLRAGAANLKGHLAADGFVISRAGMELATLTTRADATGTYHPGELQIRLDVPRGTLKLPKRTPRTLQSLERRSDIIVGPRTARRAAPRDAAGAEERPFTLTVRVVAPGKFDVVSDSPRVRIELKADATYELQGADDYMSGAVEVVRGNVEPIGGRIFEVQRGKVTFTGGPPKAAMLDVEARWDNPTAVVTVRVAGPLSDPEIKLSSQPPLDESQIAMLIATGRTELKAGGGAVGTLTGEEAGKAVLGALATQVFKDLVADKLPLDTVALDSGALRAGKYVTDRVYVGYTRRFDARPELGENTNELRVEYQISPHWSLESRYGDAQSGGASLIWSKDY